MAIMWNGSLIPWLDPNAAPYSGAKAYFFNAGTTTPRTVYQNSVLGESHDHPVVANANGMFPAVFLTSGTFRLRITDAGGVTIWDVDGISVPTTDVAEDIEGDTPVELLARTSDYKFRHGTGSHSGWVRAAGRTIGNAASGATERANADCEDLYLHLWNEDSTLSVSGGRGANAASDWAAGKTIALPDIRLRGLIGMASMGNTASTIIAAGIFDGGVGGDELGATVGTSTVTLSTAQMPVHSHGAGASTAGAHSHGYSDSTTSSTPGSGPDHGGGSYGVADSGRTTTAAGAHDHVISISNAGEGAAHVNVQPSVTVTCYLKL